MAGETAEGDPTAAVELEEDTSCRVDRCHTPIVHQFPQFVKFPLDSTWVNGYYLGMEILITATAQQIIDSLAKGKKADPKKLRKIRKTLDILAIDTRHPSLATHRYETLDKPFGVPVWQSYIEQGTPSAWRIWWYFGPADGTITILTLGPHP